MNKALLTILMALSLGACSIHPFTPLVKQGIQLTTTQIEQLKPGMTQEQVTAIIGRPNLNQAALPNEWIYVYLVNKNGIALKKKLLKLTFKSKRLVGIAGNYEPPKPLKFSAYSLSN